MTDQRRVLFQWLLLGALFIAPAAAPSALSAETKHHSLWKVEGKSNTVYLLGSIHLLKESDYPLPAVIENAFTNSKIAAFETDIGEMESPEAQMKLLSQATLPPGETLEQQLSPEVYSAFTNYAREAGLPTAMLARFKPSMAAVTLVLIELQKLGLDPEAGVDRHFFKRARKDGKETVALETLDFQISLLTDLSKEEGELFMKTTLKEIGDTKKLFREMIEAWRTGDTAGLEKLLNEAKRDAPALFKRLVTDRNERWIAKIEELLRSGKNAIVIVGAGHLVGSKSVTELLTKKGFKIKQL
jgi:uncharacterized protein YbaP (TraB family)